MPPYTTIEPHHANLTNPGKSKALIELGYIEKFVFLRGSRRIKRSKQLVIRQRNRKWNYCSFLRNIRFFFKKRNVWFHIKHRTSFSSDNQFFMQKLTVEPKSIQKWIQSLSMMLKRTIKPAVRLFRVLFIWLGKRPCYHILFQKVSVLRIQEGLKLCRIKYNICCFSLQ